MKKHPLEGFNPLENFTPEKYQEYLRRLYAVREFIDTEYEGLTWIRDNHTLKPIYQHIEKYITDLRIFDCPEHIKICQTDGSNTFVPEKWKTVPISELVIIDTQTEDIILYCICRHLEKGINPLIFRWDRGLKRPYMEHSAVDVLEYILKESSIIINSFNEIDGGGLDGYWFGRLNRLVKRGYTPSIPMKEVAEWPYGYSEEITVS
ncbi:hypothetical protein [Escherichia albertii]|uniref:hypothetical protein n=1 Tax=Escherichia albertii TaxID=208962 RepID=UPI000BF940D1|nr:hypothetical protein [Escherichia albertii]PFF96625.1 hypothetical protein CRH02_06780 [Escherichia albertii]